MPHQSEDYNHNAWPFVVLFAVICGMLVVSNALYEINHPKETIEEAPAAARTLEINPEPGVEVYVHGRKCR